MKRRFPWFATFSFYGLFCCLQAQETVSVRGRIVDADTREMLPARLYIESAVGEFFHAKSRNRNGDAVPYSKIRPNGSVEVHTSLSPHSFVVDLVPGEYTLTAERGKEYCSVSKTITVEPGEPLVVSLRLKRWINMAERGWYSGETHVHRTVEELPTLMLVEDLNVAFPLTAWVTDTQSTPAESIKNPDSIPAPELMKVDSTHVIWPVNTEYEIFTVSGTRHPLGAVFILNHKEAFELAVPPATPVAEEARRQGGILELDKHNWPWSMMLVPVMKVGLFELTNNHIWRTQFQFKNWYSEYAGEYMDIEMEEGGFTEDGWINFGFKNYYALLNCGFDMKPTAGTASGVHPVPLGYGRVYVKVAGEFSYDKWLQGLTEGNSFVTTGPMLESRFEWNGSSVVVSGRYETSSSKHGTVEVIQNGEVTPFIDIGRDGSFEKSFPLSNTSWFAVRVIEEGRSRFAHSAPKHFKVQGKPLNPKPTEVDYLVKRVEDEIARHSGVLEEDAMAEYRKALEFY
ncbi:hypothetical protein F7C95_08045 [Opitutia bacterium ISCC 51]|nr:hypothetical protein F7C95_08045 [Opitutae bacterium ISCC 51]QXD29890.1 hypothetical protein GA003_07995 [Opitutae bacterium ISCC 52]